MTAAIRTRIRDLETQQILQVSRLALGDPKVIPLWYGESDVPTPDFIGKAASDALAAGHTFYTHKQGIPELRDALAAYTAGLYGVDMPADRITVTSSGMTGIMLATEMLVDAGDNVVIVGPVWPNARAAVEIMGGEPRGVALRYGNEGWRLDVEEVLARCDGRTRAVFVNSPGNPTGWMMPRAQQEALLSACRERGIWVIADEVYARIVYDRRAAPSFLEVAGPDDPLIVINSFSKAWAMTGWRLGWLTHPVAVGTYLANLVEYNTSGTPAFLQHAGVTAVRDGEDVVASMVARCREGRDVIGRCLAALPRVRYNPPDAAFYAFFAVDGMDNSLDFAKRLVHEAGVGVAPGTAFGPEGEGFLRLCFARAPETLEAAAERLAKVLG
ncbi:MAG: pyridoxal phosphate-dependent aminotransferase [Gammaproteobacteria bacterium]|jgi:aspartate/methionine/tyrosine aminotransferase